MKSRLAKVIAILIGLALAFAAGIYGASLLDPTSRENAKEKQKETAKEEKELPEIDIDDEEEQADEGVGEVSSEDNDGHKIEDPDPSAEDDGLIIIDSDDDSYEQAPTEYSDSDFYDEKDDDELPEIPIVP